MPNQANSIFMNHQIIFKLVNQILNVLRTGYVNFVDSLPNKFANGSMKYLFVLDVPHDNFTNILPVKINRKIFFNYFSICVTSSHITADRVPEMIPNCG